MRREEKQLFVKNIIKKITAHKNGDIKIEITYKEVVDKIGKGTIFG